MSEPKIYTFRFLSPQHIIYQVFTLGMLSLLVAFSISIALSFGDYYRDALRLLCFRLFAAGVTSLIVIQLFKINHRRQTRIEIQGEQIRLFLPNGVPDIEQSLGKVICLSIDVQCGAKGIKSRRKIDFVSGPPIEFDGQVEYVDFLEDLILERSGYVGFVLPNRKPYLRQETRHFPKAS